MTLESKPDQTEKPNVPVAMAAAAVKCKRAGARAQAKAAQQGGPSPQPPGVAGVGVAPITPGAGEATAGGPAQLEDPEA